MKMTFRIWLRVFLSLFILFGGYECMVVAFHLLNAPSDRAAGKAQAIQNAERARNELAQTQAEAAKKIAEADGTAKSAVALAQGEAEANKIRQSSLTPQLLELRRVENQKALIDRWNGALPQVESGGNGMMLQLPKPQ